MHTGMDSGPANTTYRGAFAATTQNNTITEMLLEVGRTSSAWPLCSDMHMNKHVYEHLHIDVCTSMCMKCIKTEMYKNGNA